jgi:signal transduction histidine kinase/CheY-like chemotaxis protein
MLGVVAQLLWLGSRDGLVSAVYMFVLWGTLVAASVRFARVMHSDITQRYRNEALVTELSAQKEKAEAASEAKSRFLAAASHDLRQPVHAVALLAGALQQHEAGSEQSALLKRLQGGVAHFADVVDEVLDIARLDAGAVPVVMQAVRVQDLLDRIDSTYRALADAKGIALLIRPPATANAAIHADPALTWRVLSNLVGNAVRYTAHGSVLVAVRRHRWVDNHARTAPEPPGPEMASPTGWRIEVRDSGPGIETAKQALVFEEFFQLHNPQRDSSQGLGLGLAVAQRMARLMNLPIGLRSAPDKGTTFSIAARALAKAEVGALDSEFPPDRQIQAASFTNRSQQLQGLRALVVDDDVAACEAMRTLLQSWGVQVQLAASAAQAKALVLAGYYPQVLMTDHWLTEQDNAFTVEEHVRSALLATNAPVAPLHVAVFTGDISLTTQKAVRDRAWYFAPKPLRPLALRMWLESCQVTSTPPYAP